MIADIFCSNGYKNLVEVRAGKMFAKGKMVYPDRRRGRLFLYKNEQQLLHFCWQDRYSGFIEDDVIIFREDCEYERVPKCTTGRVYMLRFKISPKKMYYWLQEPKTDKDDEHCRLINELIQNQPSFPGLQSSVFLTPLGNKVQYLIPNAQTCDGFLGGNNANRPSYLSNFVGDHLFNQTTPSSSSNGSMPVNNESQCFNNVSQFGPIGPPRRENSVRSFPSFTKRVDNARTALSDSSVNPNINTFNIATPMTKTNVVDDYPDEDFSDSDDDSDTTATTVINTRLYTDGSETDQSFDDFDDRP